MKPYPILLLTLLILTALQAIAQPARFNLQDLNQIACKEQTGQAQFVQKQASAAAIANDVCNITYARTHWNIDPAINYISGSVTYYFLPLTPNFDTLYLDLSASLTVDSVIYHAQNLPFSQADTELLYLLFPDALPTNTLDSVSIYYQGAPPQTGFGSFIQTDHNGTPIIWTLSEPYGASDWWPCKDDLTDKIDSLDAIVTCPSGYRAAGNGILVSETSTPTQTICHWQHRHPIATYLVATAVTNYAAYTDLVPFGTDTVPMLNYVYPENLDEAIPLTADQVKVMQLYDSLFIVYPFKNEKYGHAQFSWGGGMEHQTMSFVVNFGFELLAHEMAHQWFGDHVTCGSWQDIWLNEGFATYLSGLCYEHLFDGVWWMPFKTGRINAITSQPDGSVWCSDTTDVNRIFNGRLSYAKGAMVLHQLRWVIGDQAFFTALRNYLNDPQLAGGFARTQNLISHFEATSGQDLSGYFNDWFYGQGFPSYEIGWYFPQPDSTHLGIAVIQTQSHPSVSFFEMPLPIRVFYNGGQDTLLRVNLTDTSEPAQFFNYILPYAADSIQFDPEKWLITNNNEVYFLIVDGTNPLTQAGNLRLYPNPAHTTLVVDAGQQNINRIEVFTITGNLQMAVSAANTARQTLSTDALPPGLYWVKAYTNAGVQVQKFVKQ